MHPARRCSRAPLLLAALLVLPACLEDEFPDLSAPPPPASCGNGVCDPGAEDCLNCPGDCPCCNAVFAVGSTAVTNPDNALGAADGTVALLDELSALTLVLGGEMVNDSADATQPDFTLEGKVTSTSVGGGGPGCSGELTGTGAFSVSVSANGSVFEFVGAWTQENSSFDLGCAKGVTSARWVRIIGQTGATAELDALSATSCSALGGAP